MRPSTIAGEGLFARAPIAAGTVVPRLGGRLVTWPELQSTLCGAAQRPGRPYIDTITVTGALHLVLPPGNPNGKGNHGGDPNLWWVDACTLAARTTSTRTRNSPTTTRPAPPAPTSSCRAGAGRRSAATR